MNSFLKLNLIFLSADPSKPHPPNNVNVTDSDELLNTKLEPGNNFHLHGNFKDESNFS